MFEHSPERGRRDLTMLFLSQLVGHAVRTDHAHDVLDEVELGQQPRELGGVLLGGLVAGLGGGGVGGVVLLVLLLGVGGALLGLVLAAHRQPVLGLAVQPRLQSRLCIIRLSGRARSTVGIPANSGMRGRGSQSRFGGYLVFFLDLVICDVEIELLLNKTS